jgi:hypothetical protein
MIQEKIKTAVQTWVTPSLVMLCLYFIKTNYEEILRNQKEMMLAIPVMKEKQNQLDIRVTNIERVLFTDNMNRQDKTTVYTFKPYFLKPEEIKLPRE